MPRSAASRKGFSRDSAAWPERRIAQTEPSRAYDEHFSRAGKAYPVLLQATGVATKGRRISMPDPLVRSMFAAELEGMLLTAGHDLDAFEVPVVPGAPDLDQSHCRPSEETRRRRPRAIS